MVKIGQYFCDPIPLHCTVNQIACKTRPALEGMYAKLLEFARMYQSLHANMLKLAEGPAPGLAFSL